jgi:hypothetical protein
MDQATPLDRFREWLSSRFMSDCPRTGLLALEGEIIGHTANSCVGTVGSTRRLVVSTPSRGEPPEPRKRSRR